MSRERAAVLPEARRSRRSEPPDDEHVGGQPRDERAALNTFLQLAEHCPIAHAHEHVVVTHEVAADSTKRPGCPHAVRNSERGI